MREEVTNWIYCRRKIGRGKYSEQKVHFLVCHLKCIESGGCDQQEDHDRMQTMIRERERQSFLLPANQNLLPGWKIKFSKEVANGS